MIGRRSPRDRGKDVPEKDEGTTSDAALFNLEELHEKRILSWSPEPDEDPLVAEEAAEPAPEPAERRVFAPRPPDRPISPAAAALARQEAAPRPAPPEAVEAETAAPEAAAPAAPPRATPAQPAPTAPATPPQASPRTTTPVSPPRTAPAQPKPAQAAQPQTTPAPTPERPAAEPATQESGPRRRGRPRGRPRRQVHFHVDPDEERMLMYAVELYGSQQKGLIAALQALQDAEFLRSEIERLKAENERQRELLAEAESLFNR